jgi:hypothetical protein
MAKKLFGTTKALIIIVAGFTIGFVIVTAASKLLTYATASNCYIITTSAPGSDKVVQFPLCFSPMPKEDYQ